jgi:hypothetical protein
MFFHEAGELRMAKRSCLPLIVSAEHIHTLSLLTCLSDSMRVATSCKSTHISTNYLKKKESYDG